MNKFKKLAAAAVSVVMTGTMVLSLAACGEKKPNGGGNDHPDYSGKDYYGILNEDGTINYGAYEREGGKVTLSTAVGHNSLTTSISYKDLGGTITLPNKTEDYKVGDVKPAWQQMGDDLNITWNDLYEGKQTNANLKTLLTENQTGTSTPKYAAVDLFTTDLSLAVSYSASGEADILNLADYLDYMPNFRQFLNENPIVYLSLLQDGMSTKDGKGQEILVAPYFDGNDDIERYCIIRHDWAEKLLNGDTATGSTEVLGKDVQVQPFMGSADYEIDALTADGSSVIKVKKNYTAALAAAKDESKPLGAAYKAIANAAYNGDSGNIVAIMNAALAANANATGAQLVNLFRAYIDVAFTKADGSALYSADNRAHVFTGYDACWDVDDLVAMLRCVRTNEVVLVGVGKKIGGIAPRSGQSDRTSDIVSLACQLYGVRGGTSRNEFTYIDNAGNIKDARETTDFYNAMANMNALYKEGLIANYSSMANFTTSSGLATKDGMDANEYFMVYDYSQTQTLEGFYLEDGELTGGKAPKGYYFAPVLTPVSKWDVNGNNTIEANEYFRFTESWRSTKTGGLAANGAVKNNKAKLDAVLQFIDYLYSEDGQIVSSFGPMATNKTGDGGFWYNEEATAAQVAAGNYFTYKGVKYSGTDYKGKTTPTITDNLYKSFKGLTVNGWKVSDNNKVSGAKLNFTNYARMLIGSTLPVGVKDQSFENQLTSKMGQTGAGRVGVALAKGVVKGMSLDIDPDNYWFTCSPTGLPVSEGDQEILDHSSQDNFMYMTGKQKGDKNFFSIMNYIVLNGTSGTYNQQDVSVSYTSISDLLSKTLGGTSTISGLAGIRRVAYNNGWSTAKDYWDYLSKNR